MIATMFMWCIGLIVSLTILIGAVIIAIYMLITIPRLIYGEKAYRKWLSVISAIILLPICATFAMSGVAFSWGMEKKENCNIIESEYKLSALQDSRYYVVYRRNVSTSDVYDYIIEHDGFYKTYSASRIYSKVIFTDEQPKLIIKKYIPKNPIKRLVSENVFYIEYEYDFYIPENSIQQDYNIDLKN